MIQLTRSGTTFSGSAQDLEALRRRFDRQHCLKLRQLLDPELLQLIQRKIDQAEFHQRIHEAIASELWVPDVITRGLLHFLTNDPKLFSIIQQITGCGHVGCFMGRVYRMVPGCDHYDSWHEDMIEDRIIGMSINLSKEVYYGGIFQIRDHESGEILHQVANTGFGDGIIFRLAHHLQHRITNVEGAVPKTALAGWFKSQPDFYTLLKSELSELR